MAAHNFDLLRKIVAETQCKPGWEFFIREEEGALRLVIQIECEDNYAPGSPFRIRHFHPVPVAEYNEATWRRWIFDQCMRSMVHEIGECLRFGPDEERPFQPCHAPMEDPYILHDFRDPIEARKRQDGSIKGE